MATEEVLSLTLLTDEDDKLSVLLLQEDCDMFFVDDRLLSVSLDFVFSLCIEETLLDLPDKSLGDLVLSCNGLESVSIDFLESSAAALVTSDLIESDD